MGSICKNCKASISWDEQKRAALNTTRPLNPDGTIHSHGGNGSQQQPASVTVQKPVTEQEQRSRDIRDAQKQRKQEHDELMAELRNLRRAIVAEIASRKDVEAQDVINSIGFEESREEQRDFENEVV